MKRDCTTTKETCQGGGELRVYEGLQMSIYMYITIDRWAEGNSYINWPDEALTITQCRGGPELCNEVLPSMETPKVAMPIQSYVQSIDWRQSPCTRGLFWHDAQVVPMLVGIHPDK